MQNVKTRSCWNSNSCSPCRSSRRLQIQEAADPGKGRLPVPDPGADPKVENKIEGQDLKETEVEPEEAKGNGEEAKEAKEIQDAATGQDPTGQPAGKEEENGAALEAERGVLQETVPGAPEHVQKDGVGNVLNANAENDRIDSHAKSAQRETGLTSPKDLVDQPDGKSKKTPRDAKAKRQSKKTPATSVEITENDEVVSLGSSDPEIEITQDCSG